MGIFVCHISDRSGISVEIWLLVKKKGAENNAGNVNLALKARTGS